MNTYDVICRGKILPGRDAQGAREKLAHRFKVAPQTLDRLVAGRPVAVKKNTDRKTAEKYRQAGKKCGVQFEIFPTEAQAPEGKIHPQPDKPHSRTSRTMTCPHCGFDQALSSTCIHCGKFSITSKKTMETPPPPQSNALPKDQPTKPSTGLFRKVRIAILVTILIGVGLSTWKMHLRVSGWHIPLTVGIYPINADDSAQAAEYIEVLYKADLDPIGQYFAQEAKKYGLGLDKPFRFVVANEIDEQPPPPPAKKDLLSVVWWSLKIRYWAYSAASQKGISPDIKLFVLYYDTQGSTLLDHSIGLKKGMIGIVHAYADDRSSDKNHVIMAHEILHTVGATDKYNPASHQPIHPGGYAEPDLDPPYPQTQAEIMGSRIPVTQTTSTMPPDLSHTLIGPITAQEISWIE